MVGGGIVYDAAGNMTTTNTGQSLVYNAENQVTSVNSGAVANYTYGPGGERIRKDLPGGVYTEYVSFGGSVIAEKNQAGDWTDYIYADGKRIAKADSFENGIMIQGNNCANCGVRHTWFTLNDAQSLSGFTIQAGDKLYFRQYQANARGGMGIFFRDGTNNVWNSVDQNGQYTNDDPAQQTWDQRSVDLSGYAGKVIDWIGLDNDNNAAGGQWAIVFGDIALVSADGSVHSIYNGSPDFSVSLAFANSGVTGATVGNRHLSNVGWATFSTTEYYHEDHLGTSRLMTSFGGWPVWQGTFSPFGQEINRQFTTNHYKFTGKERDDESGLDYFGARYYGPALGGFTSPDPLLNSGQPWNPQSWNRYSYTLNNPLRYTDPTGLYVWGNCSDAEDTCEAERQRFRDSVANLKRSAVGLKEGSKERRSIEGILSKLGEEGKGNIKINFGDAGKTDGMPNLGRTVGNSITINYAAVDSVKHDVQLNASETSSLDAGVTGHEATHAGSGPSILGLVGMRGERPAYTNESIIYQGLHNTDRPFLLWNESWATLDAQTLNQTRDQAVQHAIHPDKVPSPIPHQKGTFPQ